jgi:excinuclease ABC subunit A
MVKYIIDHFDRTVLTMPLDAIVVRGAREHNLKNIDVVIPRDKFVVITGLSGSGKSSLAFDTIYAEGQRRYIESLSAYARQFLGRMEKPDVDYIEGLSPAISIDQKGVRRNPRSTVGTVTEVYDYLRLLFARVGHPHCPKCGREITSQTVQQIVDAILALPQGTRFMIMAPLIKDRKGEHLSVFDDLRKAGYVRVRVDGKLYDLSEEFALDKNKRHTIEAVVDRLVIGEGEYAGRIADSVETALKLGRGVVLVSVLDGEELLFSEHFACVNCGISIGEIAPRSFSFNSPHGACPTCTGLGVKLEIDPALVIPNKDLSLAEGAVQPWARASTVSPWYYSMLNSVARKYGFSTYTPVRNLTKEQLNIILYGSSGRPVTITHETQLGKHYEWDTSFEGVIPNLERRYRDTESDYVRSEIERYMTSKPCPACEGQRLKPESLAVTVGGLNISKVTAMSIGQALEWTKSLDGSADGGCPPILSSREQLIARQILKEIRARLGFLMDVGLDYLTLDRLAGSLSGGEAERIRLATQIGSGLMGVLYICDEPTVGLHPVDDSRLIETLKRLRDLGNTLLIVEHDEAMMRAADHIIDMGPGAGEHGGWVVVSGTIEDVKACPNSLTGQYLSGAKKIAVPAKRRNGNGKFLMIKGARQNNLRNIDVKIPLGVFVCVTGVSGSGKSTLIDEILHKKLSQVLYKAKDKPGECDAILGIENIDKVVNIDQSPIGRTPRSNPATYTGAFTPIRELFATVPEARMRGYQPGRFSFNVKGGRCEACRGEGYIEIEMQFLPDVTVPCEICKGKRYNREALEIYFKGKNIAEVLEMSVEEAYGFFEHFPAIKAKLATLRDVGLGYIRLGQPATTLSGGEAQRVKLATELSRRSTGRTLYILDEPTTGLSFEDVAALHRVLQRLVDAGNTVVLIEHHLDLIKCADYIIDLGPGGGDRGGRVVATGTPEQVAETEGSYTGQYLREKGTVGK